MGLVERRQAVLDAMEAWIDVVQSGAPFSERVEARKAFAAALDKALTATDRGAVALEAAARKALSCLTYDGSAAISKYDAIDALVEALKPFNDDGGQ